MCALVVYDAWLAQSDLAPETLSSVCDYDWDKIEKLLGG
uniref:Uncharacterized protein n=1 Tax=uncultured bacterium contig00001 TaxID=1181493 RepID=A0A806KJC6_9BACT|nr:hypothetical protein [uncultured bacterium contig00001]